MSSEIPNLEQYASVSAFATDDIDDLLQAKGIDFFRRVGVDAVREVVFNILIGKNLRDSTEFLTRRRLTALNAAMIVLFMEGASKIENFPEELSAIATASLQRGRLPKSERWLSYWSLGLTHKGFQNVLRDEAQDLDAYRDKYVEACQEIIAASERTYGRLQGSIELDGGTKANLDWAFLLYLLSSIGAQTLTIRGSEKSTYGKLFEGLVLGALLHILGFNLVPPDRPRQFRREFWLSSRRQRRESDATLLYERGKGVRFDIGFIGRGNPEITLDKVSRFERQMEFGRSRWYMATIVIVDRIGADSRIVDLAREIDATVIQMSGSFWPRQVAQEFKRVLGFEHPLAEMSDQEVFHHLKHEIENVPLEDFVNE